VGVFAVGDIVAVAVADGHGSSRFAEVGARLAVSVTLPALVCFAERLGQHSNNLKAVKDFAGHPLRGQIVREWTEQVRAKAGADDAPLVDYGTTLIFALSTPYYLLLGQIGDGDLLLVDGHGEVRTPIPEDPSAFADETPSLCGRDAVHSMRIRVLPAPRAELLLLAATDGYGKSYSSDAVFHQIGPDFLGMVRSDGFYAVAPLLRGFLEQVTSGGSGDDIALAMLYWPSLTEALTEGEASSSASEGEKPEGAPKAMDEAVSVTTGDLEIAPIEAVRTQSDEGDAPPEVGQTVDPSPAVTPESESATAGFAPTQGEGSRPSPASPPPDSMEIPDERATEND